MTDNQLAAETSPYLLQHKDNPVHWQAWGDDAFDQARRDGKPVLLSVGYAACHWCHVMAHESFEDTETADLMNRLFVNVKVDREERPDVDALYQSALALLGVQGGWPLTMFLTPDRQPFWGGTYFPPENRYGRPGFRTVLARVAEVYREDRDGIAHNIEALGDALERMARPDSAGTLEPGTIDAVAERAAAQVDPVQGGTQGAPKFPQVPFFRLLWARHLATGRADFGDPVVRTLTRMSQGGIYDHVGGGFARYATDEVWLVPHFEKMLYDNAQLVSLLSEVWLKTRNPLFAARVRETIGWMLRDMRVGDAGDPARFAFASALDADSAGEEGRYYVWSDDEIAQALGGDAPRFNAAYGVRPGGNWEGHTILNRMAEQGLREDAEEEFLASCRARLLAVRGLRVPPLRDDKVLAEWNGLAVAGLVRAATAFGEELWLDAARSVFAYVRERLGTPDRGLMRSWRAGKARHPAVLEDYGAMILAGVALYEATGAAEPLAAAEAWAEVVEAGFRDPDRGGYFQSGGAVRDIVVRSKPFIDNALPSGNGLMAEALARLFHLTGDDRYRRRAEDLISAFAGASEVLPHMPYVLLGHALLADAVQVVVVGRPEEPETRPLLRAAFETPAANLVILPVEPDRDLPARHPARGRTAAAHPAAYVCRGATCGLPVRSAGDLRNDLLGL